MNEAKEAAVLHLQPHQDALRALAHGLSRWAMHGLDDVSNPIIAALRKAGDALYQPHPDAAASEIACEAALRELAVTFVETFVQRDRLTRREFVVLWEAVGYIDHLDEASDKADKSTEGQAERQDQQEKLSRESRADMAWTCFAEAQRERTRGQRNRQRQRREEREEQAPKGDRGRRMAVAA